MKRRLLLFLFSLLSGSAFAQTYIPMPTDTTTWRYRIKAVDDYTTIVDFILYMNGQDTVIGGNTYKKIFSRSNTRTGPIGFFPPITSIDATTPDIFYGGIRESSHKVYYTTVSTEQMIFDFTAVVGSFIPAYSGTIKIVSIDSILIGSTYHKRYNTTDSTYYVVEGVGSNRGLIPSLNDGSGYMTFQCFTHGTDNWTPVETLPCTSVYPIGYNDKINNITNTTNLEIFPNPTNDFINFRFSGNSTLKGKISNCLGQTVWVGTLTNNMQIPVYNWIKGIYYLSYEDKEYFLPIKKVIIY